MIKYYPVVLILPLIFSLPVSSQIVFSEVLVNNAGYACTVHSLISSYDNGYMLAGEASDNGLLAKIDSAGNYLWGKTYGTGSRWQDIINTNDSAFVLVGSNNGDGICMKVSLTGDTIWFKTLGSNSFLDIYRVVETFDKGFIMTGYESGVTPNKVFAAKLDSAGNLEWSQNFIGGNNTNYGKSIRQTPDSGFIITGYMENYPPFEPAIFIIKLDKAGDLLWSKNYSTLSPTLLIGNDIVITKDGFLCYVEDNGAFSLIQTDPEGNILWSRRYLYFGSGAEFINQRASRINQTTDSCYIFLHGSCWGSAVIKVDSTGNVVFAKELDMSSVEMVEANDRGFLIAGNGPMCGVKTTETSDPQIGIIKTDSTGYSPMCVLQDLNGVTENGTLVISSVVFTVSAGPVFTTSQPVIGSQELVRNEGCVAHLSAINDDNAEFSINVFPNPAENRIYIKSGEVIDNYKIENLSGRVLSNGQVHSSDFEIDISGLTGSVYFITFINAEKKFHQKIIKQ